MCLDVSGCVSDSSCRGYVSVNYWPNKDAGGAKLQEMYHKLAAAPPASNGR